jgi:hypothetical protein
MKSKVAMGVAVVLFFLAGFGLATGADNHIVIADLIAAVTAGALALSVRQGGRMRLGSTAVVVGAILLAAWLAFTAHTRSWILPVSLAAIIIAGFLTLTRGKSREPV